MDRVAVARRTAYSRAIGHPPTIAGHYDSRKEALSSAIKTRVAGAQRADRLRIPSRWLINHCRRFGLLRSRFPAIRSLGARWDLGYKVFHGQRRTSQWSRLTLRDEWLLQNPRPNCIP